MERSGDIKPLVMFRCCALFLICAVWVLAADTEVKKPDPTPAQIQDIIKKFAQKETGFAAARENYTYRQTTKMTETDPVGGAYEMVEEVGFDDRDRRSSHVVRAPVTSLQNIFMTNEDEQDMRNTMPFVFTSPNDLDSYNIKYVGREQVDEIGCYVFSLTPKELTKDKKRYFEGQIWVDDQDIQIVKTFGKGISYKSGDQQFPKFTTYREQIDDVYWFPTYTYADDTLNFKGGQSQRIKVVIKYDHYKKYIFKTDTSITYGTVGNPTQTAPNTPAPPHK
jgi:hypothetical protein